MLLPMLRFLLGLNYRNPKLAHQVRIAVIKINLKIRWCFRFKSALRQKVLEIVFPRFCNAISVFAVAVENYVAAVTALGVIPWKRQKSFACSFPKPVPKIAIFIFYKPPYWRSRVCSKRHFCQCQKCQCQKQRNIQCGKSTIRGNVMLELSCGVLSEVGEQAWNSRFQLGTIHNQLFMPKTFLSKR